MSGKLCANKMAEDELAWDARSEEFDRVAAEEIRLGRAQESGLRDPVRPKEEELVGTYR